MPHCEQVKRRPSAYQTGAGESTSNFMGRILAALPHLTSQWDQKNSPPTSHSPSSLGRAANTFGVATTRAGQARRLAEVIPQLAAARKQLGIDGFDVYTWMGDEFRGATAFNYSGLFAFTPRGDSLHAKPAYAAFRQAALAAEGCRVKAAIASRCRRSG